MYGQEQQRKSLDDLWLDMERETSATTQAKPKPRPKATAPRRSLDDLWNEQFGGASTERYGPEIPPEMLPASKPVAPATAPKPTIYEGPDIDEKGIPTGRGMVHLKPAGVAPRPPRAAKPREREAAWLIRDIEGRRNRATELFRLADAAERDLTGIDTGQNKANAQLLRQQADAELYKANLFADGASARYGDLIETGFGADADPTSKRKWAYAKAKTPELRDLMFRDELKAIPIRQRLEAERNPITPEQKAKYARQRKTEASRAAYEELSPLSQLWTRAFAKLGGASDADMAEAMPPTRAESIRNQLAHGAIATAAGIPQGLQEIDPFGWNAEMREAERKRGFAPLPGKEITKAGNDLANVVAPIDKTDEAFFTAKLPRGLGSSVPFLVSSALGGGMPAAAILGSAINAQQAAEDLDKHGITDEATRRKATAVAGLIGSLEAFGIEGKLNKVFGGRGGLVKRLMSAGGEGVQESTTEELNDINAKLVAAYDPNRSINPLQRKQLEALALGSLTGGLFEAGGKAAELARGESPSQIRSALDARTARNFATAVGRTSAPIDIRPAVPAGTQTAITPIDPATVRNVPRRIPAPPVSALPVDAGNPATIAPPTAQVPPTVAAPLVAPAPVSSPASPTLTQPIAPLFPQAQAQPAQVPDLSALSPQDRAAAMLDQIRQTRQGRANAGLEQQLNAEFTEGAGLIGSAAQSWDADRPTAELLATTGAQRLKTALQNLQKSEAYQMELGAVASGAAQPGPYIAAAQSIQQQLDQASSLFQLDAERERLLAEQQRELEKQQKKADKEVAKQAKFAEREQQKLARQLQIEGQRAQTQAKRDEAAAKRMETARAAQETRRAQLEQQREQSRNEKTRKVAEAELQRIQLHDAALEAADAAGRRHQEYLNQGMVAEAINELAVQQNQLRDAARQLPRTPQSQAVKADLNRYQGQIGNRIGDLRKQMRGQRVPVTQPIPPLFRPDAAVNPEGGTPELPSFYEPGAVFDREVPTIGDTEMETASLLTAVRRLGGIRADGISDGELERLGVRESGTTGLINQRGGLAPDRMRESLVQDGLLPPDATISDMLEAIEGEIRAGQRKRPTESIDEFYERWEAENKDEGTRGQRDREMAETIEEAPDGIDAEDYAALQRSIARSTAENPRPYGERTRPGEPGSGLVSFSEYAELERRNVEPERALYENEPTSETFKDAIDWITEDAAKAGIEQRHVDAMIAYALNWHGEKVFWESQGLSMGTVQGAIQSVDEKRAEVLADARRLPPLQRTEIEREVAALDTLFDDPDAVNLLERAAQGEDNAADEFNRVANEYGVAAETAGELIRARRPVRRANSAPQNAASARTGSNSSKGQKDAGGERGRPATSLQPLYDLLRQNPATIPDIRFDSFLRDLEGWRNEGIHGSDFGGVDLPPSLEQDLRRKLAATNEERQSRVKAKRLPAKHAPLPIPTPEQRADVYPGKLRIAKLAGLTEAQRAVEAATAADLEANLERYLSEYAELFGDHEVNADKAKELFEAYQANTTDNAAAVHTSSSWMAGELFRRRVEALPPGSKVAFLAGGPGAGKSTVLDLGLLSNADVVLDTTMADTRNNRLLIDQALFAGHDVTVMYVHRPVELAARGAVIRAGMKGRTVPELHLADKHFDAQGALFETEREYSGNPHVEFVVLDNGGERLREMSLEDLEAVRYNDKQEVRQQVQTAIDDEFEQQHEAGRIRLATYRAFTGTDWAGRRTLEQGARRRSNQELQQPRSGGKEKARESGAALPGENLRRRASGSDAAAAGRGRVSHPDPAIDGKPILAETSDGRVVVPNPENKSGVSVVKDRAGETEAPSQPEPQILNTWEDVGAKLDAGSRRQNAESRTADDVRLGERGLPGSERDSRTSERAVDDERLPGLPARSSESDARPGRSAEVGAVVADRSTGSRRTAEPASEPARPGRSPERPDIQQRSPARTPEHSGSVSGQSGRQQGQPTRKGAGERNQPGTVGERTDQGTGRTSDVEPIFVEEFQQNRIDDKAQTAVKPPSQQADLFKDLSSEPESAKPESVRTSEVRQPSGGKPRPASSRSDKNSEPGSRSGEGAVRPDDGARGRPLGSEGADTGRPEPQLAEAPEFVDDADPTRTETQPPSAAHRPGNYEITDIEDIIPSGKKSKLQANLAAIRLLKDLQAQGRRPTADEQAVLGKFVGWGQFPDLFNDINEAGRKLETERDELKNLLSPEEYERAKRSTLNAHYTSPQVVQKMWEIAGRLGFKGGRVLEPSMGVGYFYGLMPRKMMSSSKLAGVELDPITGTIARMLYPDASINVKGFQDVKIADGFYDLVIGNVPFGDFRVHDPAYNKFRANIHDYFILKSLDKTRAGGIVAVITSTGTMDKADSRIRREISNRANLVGAMRFPDTAFEKNAGTQVVTDLLIFQKRTEGQKADTAWTELETLPDPDGGEPIPISKYYAQNPGMILGTLDRKSKLYGGGQSHVSATPDFAQRFEAAIRALPEGLFADGATTATEPEAVASAVQDKTVEGGYVLRDGRVLQRQGDSYIVPRFKPEEHRKVASLLKVRDALNALNAAQLTTGETTAPRQELIRAYDSFTSAYGPIRKTTNAKLLAEDPSSYLLLALEKSYNAKTGRAVKADIFTKDTIARGRSAAEVSSPSSALAVSLFETGKVDIDRIAKLLKITPGEAGGQLLKDGLAFENPRGGWESSESYLSGNVRKKLIEAREAAQVDEKYQANVDALEKVQPEDVPMDAVSVKLGASWLPAEDVRNFAAHLMQADASVFNIQYMPTTGTWLVSGRLAPSNLTTEVYGTSRANFIDVLDAALNDKPIKIYDKTREGSAFNLEESEKASTKVQEVRDQFADWLWMDHERAQRLHRYYNDNFNNMRVVQYTGEHYRNAEGKFVLPGMNPAIALRPNQVKDVWQAVMNGKLLDASEVGAGKTFILGGIAMEWKRLGIARKPAIAVPKPRIAATLAELQLQYPAAKILSLEKSFDKQNRKKTTAMMATGDYDIIVLSHEQLDKMPMSASIINEFIGAELAEIEERIKDAEEAAKESGDHRAGNRIVKRLEKIKERVEARLQEALDGTNKDDVVKFEETGIDALLVDEAHAFKSLPVYSRRSDVKGVPATRSDRATSMLMRTRWLMRQNDNKGVVFATGTPVTNTLAEVYNLQRYLQPEVLEDRGLENFDAWADQFANISTQFEYTASGDYKAVSRMAEFVNLPELQQSIRQIMATNFVDDMTWIARPKKIEQVVTSPMTEDQKKYLESIRRRVEALKKMSPAERKASKENFLLISTDARKSALSPAMVKPGADSGGKVERLAENVLKIHKARPDVAQMIFLDFGVNPNAWGYSVYDDIQNRLIEGGIPKEKIANFARLSDIARQKAADKLNSGEYLIGIGSSGKMGTGINAQQRLAAMHHMDAPWLPAYLEQRNGRGHRQGNLNDPTKPADEQTVEAYYYTTEGSFDVVMWQALTRKSEFIRQFMRGDTSVREMRMDDTGDEDTGEMGPEMILAATSGNPFELDRLRLIKDIEKLERQERSHRQQISRFKTQLASAGREQAETIKRIAQTEKDAEQFEATKGQKFTVTINGKTYDDRKIAGNQLAFAAIQAPPRDITRLGEYRGFDLYINKTAGNLIAYLEREDGREYRFVLNLAEPEPAFTSADANLRSSVQQVGIAQRQLEQLRRDEETAKAEINKPFKRATELQQKREALTKVEQRMADWLKRKDQPDIERRPARPQITRLKDGELQAKAIEPKLREQKTPGFYSHPGQTLFQKTAEAPSATTVLADAKIQFKTSTRGQAGTLYANDAALSVLRAAYEQSHGEHRYFANVNMNRPAAQQIARTLIAESQDTGYDNATRRKLREIAREFNLAAQSGETVSIVQIGGGRRFSDIKTSRRHELFHDAQEGLVNSRGFLVKHKYGRQLIERLAEMGYEPDDRTTEAAAFLAGGQAADFGLTDAQAEEFLRDYFDDIVATNGREALKRFVSMAPQVQNALKEARQKYGIEVRTEIGRTGAPANRTATDRGTGTVGRAPTSGSEVPGRDSGQFREQRQVSRAGFSLGELADAAKPKTTPLREIIAEHQPLVVDPYKIQDMAMDEILNASGRGVAGTLPGARALYWANKLKAKPVADRLANRQANFISDTLAKTNDIIQAHEAMSAAERGSEAYQTARKDFYKARRELHARLQRTGEYAGPVEYLAKYLKASTLTAPHILTNNVLDHLASFPFHEAQKLMGFLLPVRALRRWGVDVERTHVDFRDLVPAIGREMGAILKGTKDALPDFVHMLRYGTTDLLLDEEIARQQVAVGEDERSTGGADKYEIGKRAKGVPGLDQIITAVGRTHGAVDVMGRRWAFATAIASQADAIAKRVGKENGFAKEDIAALREDLAAEPSPQMVVLAMEEANRFVLDYPSFIYDLIQGARKIGEKKHPLANKAFNNALDILVKFQKIPLAAQAQSLWHYTPMGLAGQANRVRRAAKAKQAGKPISKQESAEIVERLQQGALGTLVWAGVGLLGSLAYLHFTGGDDRERVRNAEEALGLGYDPELLVGDKAIALNRLGTFGRAGSVAARLAKAAESRRDAMTGEPEPESTRAKRIGKAFMKGVVLDNPVGRGLGDLFMSDFGNPAEDFARGQIRSAQPGLLRDVAKVQDGTRRIPDTNDFVSKMKGDLKTGNPWLRKTLQPRLDALGNPAEEHNPFSFIRNVKDNPQLKEMIRLGTGLSKPKRDRDETAVEYNRRIAGFYDPATGERVPGQADQTKEALRRIANDPRQAKRSERAKARVYQKELTPSVMKRAAKLSAESVEAEREIEALRADTYEALRQIPAYQQMPGKSRTAVRDAVDDVLDKFRVRASSTRRSKSGKVSTVREKAAKLPDIQPQMLARRALAEAGK